MKRIDLYVTEDQEKWLVERTKKLGLSGKSELMRIIIEEARDGGVEEMSDYKDLDGNELPETITLKRVYTTQCQVCGEPFFCATPRCRMPIHKIVYFVPMDNNIVCLRCAIGSGLEFEPRIYKEGE